MGKAIADRLEQNYETSIVPVQELMNHNTKDAVARCMEFVGNSPMDIVINNFGINHLSWIGNTPAIDEELLLCNVMVPYWVINHLAETQKFHPTKIINIASQTARIPQRCTALYCASKAALVQLTKVVARETAPNWQVNSISPGKILGTEMTAKTDKQVTQLRGWTQAQADEYATSLIPMGRFTNTVEVTDVVMNMLSMPDYVTGINIEVMGGV